MHEDEDEYRALVQEMATTDKVRHLTDDTYGPSVGPGMLTQGIPVYWWSAAGPDIAIRWTRRPSTMEFDISGIVLYGDSVDRQRLDAINLREIREQGIERTTFTGEDAPSAEDVASMWEDQRKTSTRKKRFTARKKNETTDEFYQRVAAEVLQIMQETPGAVTKRLAERAGVEYHTANYWVKQARQRGYLPRSSRQQPAKGDK